MRFSEKGLSLSATDVANHLSCRHLTTLELELARGERPAPRMYHDPHLEVMRLRGQEHEHGYLDHLRAQGLAVETVGPPADVGIDEAAALTLEAMRRGVDVIAQGTLVRAGWTGRPDVLRRVARAGELGGWSYEPYDTKLTRDTKAESLLQLCLYAELLVGVQGVAPESMHVVTPASGYATPESYRVQEYAAYYRLVRGSLQESVASGNAAQATYPTPCAHCDVCRWAIECEARRRTDDHPSLVAGMSRGAERELAAVGIATLAGLASWVVPAGWRPERGTRATYEKLHEQARLQFASRGQRPPLYEVLGRVADEEGKPYGLGRLPEPASGDVFLDLEGDRFWGEGGLEYLFGLVTARDDGTLEYRKWWAIDRASERRAFEAVMEVLKAAWGRDPGFHVYHFAPYEPAALKRLASRHGIREDEVDALLRGERFVDLLRVVRQGVRAGVESYSIKKLEPLYDFEREAELADVGRVRSEVEVALELGLGAGITADDKALVELYNRDDCRSTSHLRDWLEARRAELVGRGAEVSRPPQGVGEPSQELSEHLARVRAVAARLLDGVPDDPRERTYDQQARWILAQLLEFHRREQKVQWWEFYRLADLSPEDRLEEPCAIAGLQFESYTPSTRKNGCAVHRYRFPQQDIDARQDVVRLDRDRAFGTILNIDPRAGWVEIKVSAKVDGERPSSVFLFDTIRPSPKDESLLRLGEQVAEQGVDAAGAVRGGRDLLLRQPPRLFTGARPQLRQPGEELLDAARRLVLDLDGGVLPIQGPPGSGKTYTGAQMIVELVRHGKRVGVTATSHKVIRNLLDAVIAAAAEAKLENGLCCLHKVTDEKDADAHAMPDRKKSEGAGAVGVSLQPGLTQTTDNKDLKWALDARAAHVIGGTAWLWAREEMAGSVDVLLVDEAGQMSLADVLAASPAARNLVLLGDPQQLEQPIQGAHPDGCAVAALEHLLLDDDGAIRPTMPPDRGLFIDHTRRMHPDLCSFTSEQFYEEKLRSLPGLERQRLDAPPPFQGAGLFHLAVEHEGRSNASPEEAEAIASLIAGWLKARSTWVDERGERRKLTLDDILVVAPYNAQLILLREAIGRAVSGAPPAGDLRVGTVDKFQGQEAAVVIYSMSTSTPEDAPRGMEFLYSLNRLNVATSRARCACVVVASPRLLEPPCRTPRQMRLASALCRYVELARRVDETEPAAVPMAAIEASAASCGQT